MSQQISLKAIICPDFHMINYHGIEKEVESFQGRSLTSQAK